MNEALKRLTEESRSSLAKALANKVMVDIVANTKAATDADSGSFKVIVSTADRDRQGDIVMQEGWDLSFFKLNPVVLWAHDYYEPPVGVCTSIGLVEGKLVAEGKFAPTEFGQEIRKLYDLGMLRTTSVGFIPKEFDPNDNCIITRAELLEFSFVPVPANAYALTLLSMKEKNVNVAFLATKGIKIEVKEGDPQPAEPVAPADPVAPVEPAPEPAPASVEPAPAAEPVAPVEPAPAAEGKDGDPSAPANGDDAGGAPTSDQPAAEAQLVRFAHAIKTVTTSLEECINALKEATASEGGKSAKDAVAAVDKVENLNKNEGLVDVTAFITARELVRKLDIACGKALRAFNRTERAASVK